MAGGGTDLSLPNVPSSSPSQHVYSCTSCSGPDNGSAEKDQQLPQLACSLVLCLEAHKVVAMIWKRVIMAASDKGNEEVDLLTKSVGGGGGYLAHGLSQTRSQC